MLPSIGSEVVKAVVAQYNAESLLTKREEVSEAVSESLRRRACDFNIILDDVSITHLSFSGEFTKAVEAKQVAEQDAQRAQFVVMKAEQVLPLSQDGTCASSLSSEDILPVTFVERAEELPASRVCGCLCTGADC